MQAIHDLDAESTNKSSTCSMRLQNEIHDLYA